MLFTTTQEHEEFRAKVRGFAEAKIKPIAFMLDKENKFPDEQVKEMGELGWMGIPFPKEYGGAGLDYISYAIAVEELARVDGAPVLSFPPMCPWALIPSSPSAPKNRNGNTWCPWLPGKNRASA